jgi:arginase
MRVLRVPYHLDQFLPDLDVPLAADLDVTGDLDVTADPGGDVDLGGAGGLPDPAVWDRLAVLYSAVGLQVADTVRDGGLPVVQSGDCTTSLGVVAGLQQAGAAPGIVWFDSHGDVQTLETTASGYLGGLPLRLLAGYRPELIADLLGLRAVPEDRIVLAGARDLDPPETDYLAGAAIRCLAVADLTEADLPDGPLYLHLDADVLDPGELPGLILPVPGGPGRGQVGRALRMMLGTGRVAAAGIACTWHRGQGAGASLRPWLEEIFAGS